MAESSSQQSSPRWRTYVPFIVVGVVVGLAVAPVAYDFGTGTDGTVAVVPLEGSIDGESAAAVSAMLTEARQDPSIRAVVIVSNSGGGAASASETLYFQTKRTAAEMPVVASIDASAASGAYYTIAPADRIYTKPSSVVGSVGVLAPAPNEVEPNDLIATTGPNKLSGSSEREFFHIIESLQRAFVRAVTTQRGEALDLSRDQLEEARIYSGTQAVRNGLADDIGDRTAAVREAAERAGLDDYRVRVLRPDERTVEFVSRSNYLASDAENKELRSPTYLVADDSDTVFLMIRGDYFSAAELRAMAGSRPEPAEPTEARNGS